MKIADYIEKAGIETAKPGSPHYRDGWINVRCPFCNSVKMLLGIKPTHGTCFNCGPKKITDILHHVCGVSKDKIKEVIRDLDFKSESFVSDAEATGGRYSPPKGVGDLKRLHIEYLRDRRIDVDVAQNLWGILGLDNFCGIYSWRLFLPITAHGMNVSWTTRHIGNDPRRYRNAPKEKELISAKSLLYGQDYVGNKILIFEGPMNVVTIGPGSVATMGIQYTPKQFAKMTKYPKRYVCFDAEANAQLRAQKLVEDLKPFPGDTYNIVLDSGKDANAASDRERSKLRKLVS